VKEKGKAREPKGAAPAMGLATGMEMEMEMGMGMEMEMATGLGTKIGWSCKYTPPQTAVPS
jgi:hypothetical protein